jgi:hypothetical protein
MHFQLFGLITIACGINGLLLAWRVIPISKDSARAELWHRKFGKMMKVLGVLMIGFGILEVCGVLDDRAPHKKYNSPFAPEFEAAAAQLQNGPPGMQRLDNFVAAIKTLESRPGIPPQLKQALEDYITSMQDGVEAMKAGRDTKPDSDKMADSKQRILDNLRN